VRGPTTIQRTFVSSSGSDGSACTLAEPCRSLGAAQTQTSPGGEIVVLDTAGYGRPTVTKSLTIVAPEGVHAGISVFTGTNGIDIASAGLTVVVKGISITGQGGTHGVYVTAASTQLTIERSAA
jgi:hypothetical protein